VQLFGETNDRKEKEEMSKAIIVTLDNVRPHPNADRLKLATVLGQQIVVGLEAYEGQVMVFFDSSLRIDHRLLRDNNLYAKAELNKDPTVKGYFSSNGKVKCQNFRGEPSEGFVMGLLSVGVCYPAVGHEFDSVDGQPVCSKAVLDVKLFKPGTAFKNFPKHWDTKQLMREGLPDNTECWVEEKVHGTSARVAKIKNEKKWWQFWKPDWVVVSGTRRKDNLLGHIPLVRQALENQVKDQLKCGEQIYVEIYGFGGGIAQNKEIQPGFHYDCKPGEFKFLLYRVTMTGHNWWVELPRKEVYRRAEELGLVKPHLLEINSYDTPETISKWCNIKHSHYDPNTLMEGVCVWFQKPNLAWTCLKHKSPEFLALTSKQFDKGEGDVEDGL